MIEPTHELEAFFAGDCTDEQLRVVEAWINADESNARSFMDQLYFRELVGEHLRSKADHSALALAELARYEAGALPLIQPEPMQGDEPYRVGELLVAPGREAFVSAAAYVLGRAFGSRMVWAFSAAAAVALVFSLGLYFWAGSFGGSPSGGPGVTMTPDPIRKPVATLTSSHDAVWRGDAVSPGDALMPGQRLTLIEGFALITTRRGAQAVLEAPVSIELTSSDNGLYLHTGKLVGVCEGPASQGFVVHTPYMRVKDIGTRFGVATDATGSRLRVLEGEVHASATEYNANSAPIVLTAGQSAQVESGVDRVELAQQLSDRFVMDLDAAANAPVIRGQIRYEASIPGDLSVGAYEHDEIVMFSERMGISLDKPLGVSITQPGLFFGDQLQQTVKLEPTDVDSYVIHLDTPLDTGSGQIKEATIRFSRPVVALICTTQDMDGSHDLLGLPGVRYASMDKVEGRYSGLDRETNKFAESVELSEDRQTLTLRISTGTGIDQIRVLTQGRPLNR